MKKKFLAILIALTMILTQLFVPAVLADNVSVEIAVDQLGELTREDAGIMIASLWDYGVVQIVEVPGTIEDDIYQDILDHLLSVGKQNIIGDGNNQVSEDSVRTLIKELIENEAKITNIYNSYKKYLESNFVKAVLKIPSTSTKGEVVLGLTEPGYSVPLLITQNGFFARNNDVAKGFTEKIVQSYGQESIRPMLESELASMNGKIDTLADIVNDYVVTKNISRENVIKLLNLRNMYEANPKAPDFVSSSPANLSGSVGTSSTIYVTYDMAVYGGYNDAINNITLISGNQPVETTNTVSGNTLLVMPNTILAYSTTYTLTIPQDSVASDVMRPADAIILTFTTQAQPTTPVDPPEETPVVVTPPSVTPEEEEEEEEDDLIEAEKQQQLYAEADFIAESIFDIDISDLDADEFRNAVGSMIEKYNEVGEILLQITDPEISSGIMNSLIENSEYLLTKLVLSHDMIYYDYFVSELKNLAQKVMNSIATLDSDFISSTVVDGKTYTQIGLGNVEGNELVSEEISELLEMIVRIRDLFNESMDIAEIEVSIIADFVLDVRTDEGNDDASVVIPANLFIAAENAGIDNVVLITDVATFTIPTDAIDMNIGSTLVFTAEEADTSLLSAENRLIVGNSTIYDFNITLDGQEIDSFNSYIGVTIPYTLQEWEDPDAITVFYINSAGVLENISGKYIEDTKSVYFETKHFSLYTITTHHVVFLDVPDTFWAAGYINSMASKGILEGTIKYMYSPSKNVTKAEFIAMIVKALKLYDEKAVNVFSDIDSSEMYYSEIISAAKSEIIEGKLGSVFGPDSSITREEMVAILARVLEKKFDKAIPLNKDYYTDVFPDIQLLSQRSKDDLALSARHRFIEGKPDGTFAPKDYANRAEAAKLIFMLFNFDE